MAKIDRETLVALRERLVAAEGADRQLGFDLLLAVMDPAGRGDKADRIGRLLLGYDNWDDPTSSHDGAISLFQRALPNWSRESGRSGFGNPAWCRAWNPLKSPGEGNSIRAEHNGGCEPIAILIALIDALTSEPANAR